MKRIFLLFTVVFLTLSQVCFAASNAPKLRRIHLFYMVPDTIIQCQNKAEDMTKGQVEFENTLKKYYSKRFDIRKLERVDIDSQDMSFVKKVLPLESPFLVKITLEGTGKSYDHYQNALGAQTSGEAPTVLVHLREFLFDNATGKYYKDDYGTKSYGSGTVALGMVVVAVDTDPRTNTKGSVEANIRDVCTFNKDINKYVNPAAYEKEYNRFYGNFEKVLAAEEKEKSNAKMAAVQNGDSQNTDSSTEGLEPRIAKFKKHFLSSEALKPVYIQMIQPYEHNTAYMNNLIDTYIQMGLYTES